MSKRTYFKRYIWLFDLIKNNPYITYKEIVGKYNSSIIWEDEKSFLSKRTFHRDLSEISELFGIEIEYDSSRKGYFIEYEFELKNTVLLLDSYRIINIWQQFEGINDYISIEPRKTGGKYLPIILNAIRYRRKIDFNYSKYIDEDFSKREIEPYFVKEFKNRWYVIGREIKENVIKTFALERVIDEITVEHSKNSYKIPEKIKPDTFFDESFGIFKLPNEKVETIELSFRPQKGKFIKSLPLHKSQKVIVDNNNELRIQIEVQITHDFIMELLSHGSEVKILSPNFLVQRIKDELSKSLEQYL